MSSARRGKDTRQRILAVARTHFAWKGYAGSHLQAIADDVGVQKTALYYYFESKGALFTAVFSTIVDDFDLCVTTALERDLPHQERFECFVDDLHDLLAENPDYSQLLLRMFVDRSEADLTTVEPVIRRVIGTLLRFYREGVQAGAFQKLSSRHFFQTVFGAVLFHFAARDFSGVVVGVDDVFSPSAVAWRREELRRLISRGILIGPHERGAVG